VEWPIPQIPPRDCSCSCSRPRDLLGRQPMKPLDLLSIIDLLDDLLDGFLLPFLPRS
jgi:hypothetical protein